MKKLLAAVLLLSASTLGVVSLAQTPTPAKGSSRTQLSIGYSLLYAEADGIPKLNWLLMFKDKTEEMGDLTKELVTYYEGLADTLRKLSRQYPGVRIDAKSMSDIEGDTRKAIGKDMAKDFAPIVGKSGVDFEREALLMFHDSLNEQRHLVAVMLERETQPELKKFLQTTESQLTTRHDKVAALLDRRYFKH